ncbi:MAG: site-2 protease family protein [Actinomycetia bacterium]|nr:site-2 protease family protein [Actinomycetes bacterium]
MQQFISWLNANQIPLIALNFLLIIPALVLHELSHGLVAYWLGDSTAKRAGRLTLNPLKHIDLFGTILMPLLLFIGSSGRFAFGAAKPVPINPNNFRDRQKGILLTGIAGPAMNIILALTIGLLCRGLILFGIVAGVGSSSLFLVVVLLLYQFTYINLMFAFFNLIPIPPLDGSRVLQYVLPRNLRYQYNKLERWGFIVILGIMILIPSFFRGYFTYTVDPIVRLLTGIVL